jgi:anti-anti-sigma factor
MPLTVTTAPLKTLGYVVKLNGSLDTNTFTQLDNELQRLAGEAAPLVVLDLKELAYISSAGIRVLQKAIRALGKNGGMMKLINPQAQVAKVFAVIKVLPMPLDQMFSSEAELDAYLAGIQRDSRKPGAT